MATHEPLNLSYSSTVWDRCTRRLNKNGYFFLTFYDPLTKQKYEKLEHVLIWERIHKKTVPPKCCIHHRDGNRNNNNAENLMCIPVTIHLELHAKLRVAKFKYNYLEYQIERLLITEEYETKSKELMKLWEIMPDI